ncbi:MAG: hypothetical protein A2X86_10505 [Bdellovibrionales bacterium GWA2_49_15]|nr:MAG: hypothetical protein A2X86_10505 [Bdellovibrionales bacterium GWA2_49_15]HAZ14758.1 hypothetical protein [Bdellovibrionales bacterium]
MKLLALLLMMATATAAEFPAPTTKYTKNCFKEHLKEALQTNRNRIDKYTKAHKGTRKIVNGLIIAETFGLYFLAPWFDQKARYFQKHGINIICDEMISPRGIPPFLAYRAPFGEIPEEFISSNQNGFAKRLMQALNDEGPSVMLEMARQKMEELNTRPSFNCLFRNDLTTVIKTTQLMSQHIRHAQALNLKKSPRKLSLALVKRIISILPYTDNEDRKGFKYQKLGIPILCEDFPEAMPVDALPRIFDR